MGRRSAQMFGDFERALLVDILSRIPVLLFQLTDRQPNAPVSEINRGTNRCGHGVAHTIICAR